MNKLIRLTFFASVLFAFVTSARAQATGSDCSQSDQPTMTWNQQPPDPLCTSSDGHADHSYTVYATTVDTCTNLVTNSVYAQSARQTYGIGWWFCSAIFTDQKCDPTITQQVTHAINGSDYNRFYLRAWDNNGCTRFRRACSHSLWFGRAALGRGSLAAR